MHVSWEETVYLRPFKRRDLGNKLGFQHVKQKFLIFMPMGESLSPDAVFIVTYSDPVSWRVLHEDWEEGQEPNVEFAVPQ